MALKMIRDSLDGLSPGERAHYTKGDDGKFKLELDGEPVGYVKKEKLDEFRTTNTALLRERDELKTTLAGIDLNAATTATARAAELEAKFNAEQAAHAATKAAVTAATEKVNAGRVRDLIKSSFLKAGGIPNAADMAADQVSSQFTLGEDGTLKAKDGLFSTNSPGEPLTLGEALTQMAKTQDFLFHPSSGSGSRGSGRGFSGIGTGTSDNRPVLKNPTPAQLGQYAKEIATGKMRVEHDE